MANNIEDTQMVSSERTGTMWRWSDNPFVPLLIHILVHETNPAAVR